MSDKKRFLAITALMWLCGVTLTIAQTIKGKLVDADTEEPLIGASVRVDGTDAGTITDFDGNFSLKSPKNKPTLKFSYVGYKDKEMKVSKAGNVDLGVITMKVDAVVLGDVVITSQIAVARKTPVAMSSLDPVFLEEKMGTQEFPEILPATPGVHANKEGGGHGDSEIWMRGFDNTNIATMVNGVPMNDMENGNVYWSNWSGLYDVARTVQTQRGLGASKVAAPSVGGTINIITKAAEAKKGGFVSYAMGNDNANKLLFSVSTGMNDNGWAMTLLGGKYWGDGYIQGGDFEDYNYFLSITKRINDKHQLTFSGFGAPQKHYQRKVALTIAGWQEVERKYGVDHYRYNATFGYDNNGQRRTSEFNEYHKPQLSLNHTWEINGKSSLSTAAYVSIGRGNGYSGQGNEDLGYSYTSWRGGYNGQLYDQFRKPDGTFDYGAIQDINAASEFGSAMVMTKNKNYHNWYGLLSTYTTKIGENIDFYGGIDFRYYVGTHTNEIVDLYSGEYFIDSTRASVDDKNNINRNNPMWVKEKLGVGDVVYRDYDSHVWNEGVFFQAEYSKDKLTAFVAGSASNTSYDRYDRFYYDAEHAQSRTLNFLGFTAKGGANYNLNENHNVFLNVGYISRAPKFSYGAFMNSTTSNAVNEDAKNEKIFSVEGGYGFRNSWMDVKLNVYYTKWLDKTMTKSGMLAGTDDAGAQYQAEYWMNMTGVNALHKGVELEAKANVLPWLELKGMFSMGDWQWDSNAKGYAYDELGRPLTTYGKVTEIGAEDHAWSIINLDGIRVGGSAQTTAALGATFKLDKSLRVGIDWTYEGRNYAYYSLSGSNLKIGQETTVAEPWKVPSASTIDMNASYRFKVGNLNATLSGNVNNLFDYQYIGKAYNPSSGPVSAETIYCYYNFGRTYNIRLKVNF